MKQVKADAAAVRIKDRVGKQVVEIDQISAGDHKTGAQPVLAPEDRRDQERSDPVSTVMQ